MRSLFLRVADRCSRRRSSCSLALATPAMAHPLGNTTVNHYDGLELSPEGIVDHAVEDLAEIPTYQRRGEVDTDRSGTASAGEQAAYATERCADMARTVLVKVGGDRVELRVLSSSYTERAGAVGLTSGRLECELFGAGAADERDDGGVPNAWDDDGIGWHEITAVGKGVVLRDSPFPATSISDALRAYPDDLLSSPAERARRHGPRAARHGQLHLRLGQGPSGRRSGRAVTSTSCRRPSTTPPARRT